MIVFFLPRKMYPDVDGIYVVEDGVLPLSSKVDPDILYGLVLDDVVSLSDFNRISGYRDFLDLALYNDLLEYIAEYCWLYQLIDKVKHVEKKFFHIIRIAPTFSIMNILKNFDGVRIIDISFLNNEQIKYVYRFLRENDILISHYFRLDVLSLCSKMVLHRGLERQYFMYGKLNPSVRDEAFRIFKNEEYVVFNLINGYYSILDEEYNFIKYSKKFIKKKVDYSRFKDVLELIDEIWVSLSGEGHRPGPMT